MKAPNRDDKYAHDEERKKVLLLSRAALFLNLHAS